MDRNRIRAALRRTLPSVAGAVLLALPGRLGAQVGYRVQVTVGPDSAVVARRAEQVRRELGVDIGAYVVAEDGLWKARLGDFARSSEAGPLLGRVRALGYADAWVARSPIDPGAVGGAEGDAEAGARRSGPTGGPGDGSPSWTATGSEAARSHARAREEAGLAAGAGGGGGEASGGETGPIRLDGELDDAAWRSARFMRGWERGAALQAEGAEVALSRDDEALFIGARVVPPGEEAGRERDEERLLVSVLSEGSRRTLHTFAVTRGGDRITFGAGDDDGAETWSARTRSAPSGWTAELRIPFALIGAPDSVTWRVSVRRDRGEASPRRREDQSRGRGPRGLP